MSKTTEELEIQHQLPPALIQMRRLAESMPEPTKEKMLKISVELELSCRMQLKLLKMKQGVIDLFELDVKYLLFDLEATRRERDYFRNFIKDFLD